MNRLLCFCFFVLLASACGVPTGPEIQGVTSSSETDASVCRVEQRWGDPTACD